MVVYLNCFENTTSFLEHDGRHIAKCCSNSAAPLQLADNFLFASLHACRGNNRSRRDDIETVFYLLTYIFNELSLPWSELDPKGRKMPNIDL